jgi:hypothetical protein
MNMVIYFGKLSMVADQDGEEGVDVAPNGAEDPLLLDGRDEDAGKDAKGEDQIAQRHAKHQSDLSGKFKKRKKRKSIVNDTNIIAYILYKPA